MHFQNGFYIDNMKATEQIQHKSRTAVSAHTYSQFCKTGNMAILQAKAEKDQPHTA